MLSPDQVLARLLIDIGILIATSQVLRLLLAPLRRPDVIAYVLAGFVLGPSLLGNLPGDPSSYLFPEGALLFVRGLGIGAVLIPSMSVAYRDVPMAGVPHATMNTRIAQQVGASFGTAIVAVALQSLLADGTTAAFQERSGGRSASPSSPSSPPSRSLVADGPAQRPSTRSRTTVGWDRKGWWPAASSTTLPALAAYSRCRAAGVPRSSVQTR